MSIGPSIYETLGLRCPHCGREQQSLDQLTKCLTVGTEAIEVLEWLVSMDDSDNPDGLKERKTVTLTKIIERARAALSALDQK